MTLQQMPFFRLRVLVEYESVYETFVARCLETGSVVTADDADTALEMIQELLDDEIAFAFEHNNVTNLLSSPAPLDVWKRWNEAVRKKQGIVDHNFTRTIGVKKLHLDDDPEVPAEIQVARVA